MNAQRPKSSLPRRWRVTLTLAVSAAAGCGLVAAAGPAASAHARFGGYFQPGNLLVSRTVYVNRASSIVPGVTQLPPGCTAGNCVTATADGAYPEVFNNDLADASFGVTSPIFLDQLTPSGRRVSTLPVPDGVWDRGDHMVTSFSSKSELALNLSTSGRQVTFMGYAAQPNTIDVSNSHTPGVIDPTNPVPSAYYRVVAQVDQQGRFRFTETNAYSGNNGRAAVLNDSRGANVIYTAGNAGNGGNPQPNGVILGAGAQIMTPQFAPERLPAGAPLEMVLAALWKQTTDPKSRGVLLLVMDLSRRAWNGSERAKRFYAEQQRLWVQLLMKFLPNQTAVEDVLHRFQGAVLAYLVTGDPEPGRRSLARPA